MVMLNAFDVPPAASTVSAAVLTVVSSVPGIETLSCVALVGVTLMSVPSNLTLTGAMKLVPVRFSVCAVLLALRVAGVNAASVGAAAVRVMALLFEMPPAGLARI